NAGGDLLADRTPGHDALRERRGRGFALLQHGLACLPVERVALADELVDEAHPARGAGLDHPAGEHRLHGGDRPRLPDRATSAAKAWKDSQIDLGEAEPCFVVVDRDAIVAR